MGAARITGALWFMRPWPLVCVALADLCMSMYCAMGSFHYEHLAREEQLAAQRAERANVDLQDALDRLRDEMAASQSRVDPLRDDSQWQMTRLAQLDRALDQPPLDLHPRALPLALRLSWEPIKTADGQGQQSRVAVRNDDTQTKLHQLIAERDEAAAERDRLRTRVSELDQTVSRLQAGLAAGRAAHADSDSIAGRKAAPPQVLKNFASPGWVPDHFSNETGSIVDNPGVPPRRRAGSRKDKPA